MRLKEYMGNIIKHMVKIEDEDKKKNEEFWNNYFSINNWTPDST